VSFDNLEEEEFVHFEFEQGLIFSGLIAIKLRMFFLVSFVIE
jgi:hypothetical protein